MSQKIIDAHLHLFDFRQKTCGAEELIKKMDAAKIDRAVVFGMPVIKAWPSYEPVPPKYYLDDDSRMYFYSYTDQLVFDEISKLPAKSRKRFASLICGFNPSDLHAVEHIQTVYERNPDFWCGIGEVFFRHDDITHLTYGETPRPNIRSMRPVLKFAEEKNLPILIHHNSSADFVSKGQHPQVYIRELEEMLEHTNAKIVWAHCGASRRVRLLDHAEEIGKLLEKHANLFVDISWVIFERAIFLEQKAHPRWVELLEKFSDRVMLGSDLVGNFDQLGQEIGKFLPLLSKLSESTREKITWKNAEKIYFSRN